MNELSIIFSAISIILSGISTVVAIIAISQTGKIDKSNKKMRFFINTFDEFLIQKIPRAVSYIRYEYDTSDTTRFRIRDYQELCNVLISLENDSAFFDFMDEKFYDELTSKILNIEDYIMEAGNKLYSNEEAESVIENIKEKLSELYRYIHYYSTI